MKERGFRFKERIKGGQGKAEVRGQPRPVDLAHDFMFQTEFAGSRESIDKVPSDLAGRAKMSQATPNG